MPQSEPRGFLAIPAAGKGPGVLVLHAWWGLNDTMRTLGSRLAGAGFVVFAPDLYHGKVATSIPEAEALAQTLDTNPLQVRAEIVAATEFLRERTGHPESGVAVLGFSLGAYYALDLSAARPECVQSVVLYYGTGGADLRRSRAAYLGHFAEHDPYEPAENVGQLEAGLRYAGRPVTFHHYPGTGHWFCEPDRVDAYDPEAANLAWERTLAFLQSGSA